MLKIVVIIGGKTRFELELGVYAKHIRVYDLEAETVLGFAPIDRDANMSSTLIGYHYIVEGPSAFEYGS